MSPALPAPQVFPKNTFCAIYNSRDFQETNSLCFVCEQNAFKRRKNVIKFD